MNGARLQELRKMSGNTQQSLADKLGISVRTVTALEAGSREPSMELLVKLADYFNVSTDYLLGRDSKTSEVPQPDAIAAHTDQNMTPELRAEIDRYVKQALHKYMPKDDSDKR